MEGAEKLAALLEKLRRNKENVPLEVLKTRYGKDYERLKAEIKEELLKVIIPIATGPPDWLKDCKIKKDSQEELVKIFNAIYDAGGYARKIGTATYKHYSLAEIETLAREINGKYTAELLKLFHRKTCLYATEECFIEDNPQTPRIYNDLVDKFWNEETQQWTNPQPEERKPALLIFISDKEEKKA